MNNEDKKTRKELLELIGCMHDADPRKERWLSWLENQPIISPEEMRYLLSMEYSKGRYDTITKAVEWLEDNFCEWPNEPKRVEGFFDTLEEMKKDFKKGGTTMTREEFDNLKVGDKIIHAFGGIGVVTEKEENGYTVKDKGFDCGDGLDEVSFAWNEGKIIKED